MPSSKKPDSKAAAKRDAQTNAKFGAALYAARVAKNLSQAELEHKIDNRKTTRRITQSVLSAWERGVGTPKPFPHDVFAVERALGVDLGSLSQVLGYVPTTDGLTVEMGISADSELSGPQKRLLRTLVAELKNR